MLGAPGFAESKHESFVEALFVLLVDEFWLNLKQVHYVLLLYLVLIDAHIIQMNSQQVARKLRLRQLTQHKLQIITCN